VDHNRITVICPQGCTGGTKLQIEAMQGDSHAYHEAVRMHGIPPHEAVIDTVSNRETRRKNRLQILYIWIFFNVVVFILLVLSFSLPKFGVQKISSSCGAINPVTNSPISTMYYNLWYGLGSTPECSNKGGNFCIRWTDSNAWKRFMSTTNASQFYSVSYYWEVAQVGFYNVHKRDI
jgi:hypothetical protein